MNTEPTGVSLPCAPGRLCCLLQGKLGAVRSQDVSQDRRERCFSRCEGLGASGRGRGARAALSKRKLGFGEQVLGALREREPGRWLRMQELSSQWREKRKDRRGEALNKSQTGEFTFKMREKESPDGTAG